MNGSKMELAEIMWIHTLCSPSLKQARALNCHRAMAMNFEHSFLIGEKHLVYSLGVRKRAAENYKPNLHTLYLLSAPSSLNPSTSEWHKPIPLHPLQKRDGKVSYVVELTALCCTFFFSWLMSQIASFGGFFLGFFFFTFQSNCFSWLFFFLFFVGILFTC